MFLFKAMYINTNVAPAMIVKPAATRTTDCIARALEHKVLRYYCSWAISKGEAGTLLDVASI